MVYHDALIDDIKRRLFLENQHRIHTCLKLITDEQLWHAHNDQVNSIGNLILHLCGNIRQYICSGIFQEKDIRNRNEEFLKNQNYTRSELLSLLDSTMNLINDKIDQITPAHLQNNYEVQGFHETGVGILIHVTEHFSYHVGQITTLTKILTGADTGYYAGMDLDKKSN